MQKEEPYYKDLLSGFIDKQLSVEQVEELFDFIKEQPEKYDHIINSPEIKGKLNKQAYDSNIDVSDAISSRMWERLSETVGDDSKKEDTSVPGKPLLRLLTYNKNWFRYAAAAIFVIAIGITAIVVSSDRQSQKSDLSKNATQVDALPGKNGAILTLANGEKLVLDSLGNGVVTTQGKTTVLIRNGQLVYDASTKESEILYNTMTTPKGRQYQLVLPDGSKVWLNAASSITYPVAFVGSDRSVTITGEAYFEVARNAAKPFHVNVNGMDVQVLGTHFNINSYEDEPAVATTLLEGSVKVNNAIVLSPGQQSQLGKNGRLKVIDEVDTDEVISWKNGIFSYSNADISMVMRQVERWYDIDVVYEGKKTTDLFTGSFPRTASLQQVLKMLQLSRVRFKLEGKILTVLP